MSLSERNNDIETLERISLELGMANVELTQIRDRLMRTYSRIDSLEQEVGELTREMLDRKV